jgi:hypothetical protein
LGGWQKGVVNAASLEQRDLFVEIIHLVDSAGGAFGRYHQLTPGSFWAGARRLPHPVLRASLPQTQPNAIDHSHVDAA